MQIILLHAPPWKLPAPGEDKEANQDQPPPNFSGPPHKSVDYLRMPTGLLSLAAQAQNSGHTVYLFNLANFSWPHVDALIKRARADLYGMTCYTSNRRGVAALAELIHQYHPNAHVVVGGPHVSALPRETLKYYQHIDTVVLGEGEHTFLELASRLDKGQPPANIAGTAWREGGEVMIGPARPRIDDLDTLASVQDFFPSEVMITSRGCPARCTFCASRIIWGPKVRFHSVDYVLKQISQAIDRHGLRALAIKDDTFTANRPRVLEICRQMVKRDLNVVWSCDTRADYLDEELLYAMRRAGCQRISLGVESGAPEILNAVKKKISPEKILEVTRCAQRLGFQVRYYMMVGNRGETRETFKQSLDFLQQAKPHEYSFSLLTVYPGTEEFEILCQQSADITADIYFDSKMIELERFAGDASSSQTILQATLGAVNRQKIRNFNVAECQKILDAMPDLHLSHLETALAYYQEGEMETAKAHLNRALELGYPFPEVVFNYLACIAATHGDITSAEINLKKALQISPNKLSQDNLSALRQWQEQGAAFKNGIPPLRASHDFPVISYRPAVQPLKPGPITVSSLEGTASFTIGPQT